MTGKLHPSFHSEYPILDVEAENEHFAVGDSLIAWLETCKAASGNEAVINASDEQRPGVNQLGKFDLLCKILPPPAAHHRLSAPGMAWSLVRKIIKKNGLDIDILSSISDNDSNHQDKKYERVQFENKSNEELHNLLSDSKGFESTNENTQLQFDTDTESPVRMRGNDEWAPPRAQIIFNIHDETNFRKLMQRQNYRCAGCGTKIDLELARRLVLYCHYLGKYFCKCCFSHKAIHLPGYILQKWDFHKYPVSHFALQLLDRIANEPFFNINDINPSLYRKVKKLRHLIDIRMQLYYLKIYISTCPQTEKLDQEYSSFAHQHLLQDDVHLYSLNNLIEIQHGKLYEYLNDLVSRSIAHVAKCDRCRAKGHYCQLCGPSSLISSMIHSNTTDFQQAKLRHSISVGQNISTIAANFDGKTATENLGSSKSHSRSSSGNYANCVVPPNVGTPALLNANQANPINPGDYELIFPFEIGRVAQCRACGCCFHLQCFNEADRHCPKCERMQRRNMDIQEKSTDTSGFESTSATLS